MRNCKKRRLSKTLRNKGVGKHFFLQKSTESNFIKKFECLIEKVDSLQIENTVLKNEVKDIKAIVNEKKVNNLTHTLYHTLFVSFFIAIFEHATVKLFFEHLFEIASNYFNDFLAVIDVIRFYL